MAKITAFEAGYCTHMACMVQKGAGFVICKFPARAWLIEVGNYRWLWDTGYADHFKQFTQSGIFKLYSKVTPVYLNKGESLKEQFQILGLDLSSIQQVILSHFHGDHIAGLRDFPTSSFICSYEGWQAVKSLQGFSALKQGFIPSLIPDTFESRITYAESFEKCSLPNELYPFTEGYILPNSKGQVLLVPLPGHAVGHIGAFVLTDNGWSLLASDSAWTTANYKELAGPSKLAQFIMSDSKAYYQTLHKLQQLSLNPHVTICLSHGNDS